MEATPSRPLGRRPDVGEGATPLARRLIRPGDGEVDGGLHGSWDGDFVDDDGVPRQTLTRRPSRRSSRARRLRSPGASTRHRGSFFGTVPDADLLAGQGAQPEDDDGGDDDGAPPPPPKPRPPPFYERENQAELDSAFLNAVIEGDADEAVRLAFAGACVEREFERGGLVTTALTLASEAGDVGMAVALVDGCCADVDHAVPPHGDTALIAAAKADNVDLLEVLLALGASLDRKGELGLNALCWALKEPALRRKSAAFLQDVAGPGRLALAAGDLFAAAGIERAFALAQELGAAAQEGDLARVEACYAAGAALEHAQHGSGRTALARAVRARRAEVAAFLCGCGADAGAPDARGETPLGAAAVLVVGDPGASAASGGPRRRGTGPGPWLELLRRGMVPRAGPAALVQCARAIAARPRDGGPAAEERVDRAAGRGRVGRDGRLRRVPALGGHLRRRRQRR